MKLMALIPARLGSERCPRKNVADLGGKPLIAWSIDVAHESCLFDNVVVSTDDPAVADIAGKYKADILIRPHELCRAETSMLSVVRHALQWQTAGVVVLLQPTSPFRTAEDITNAYQLLTGTGGDAVVSVTDSPGNLVFEVGHACRLRSARNVVVENGAIYMLMADHVACGGDWYSGLTYAYRMPKERSIDIDFPADLEVARAIVANREARI